MTLLLYWLMKILLADEDSFLFKSHLPFSQRASGSQLNFEALPDFVTFLSETFGSDRARRNAFYVPPLNVTSRPSAITFDHRNIKMKCDDNCPKLPLTVVNTGWKMQMLLGGKAV